MRADLKLPNDNLDVGTFTAAGKYKLTDAAYSQLLHKLQGHYTEMPQELRSDILAFYHNLGVPNATKANDGDWARVLKELDRLQSVDTDLRHPTAADGGVSSPMSATVELLQAGNQGSVTASPRRLVGMRKKTVFLTVAAVCVVAGLGAWALLRNSGGTQYRTATVSHHGDINVTISATGNPNAVVTVQVVDELQRERNACRPNGTTPHGSASAGCALPFSEPTTASSRRRASCSRESAAAHGTHASKILVAGAAGLVAGSMSMAPGEYVSVHSQADSERADLSPDRSNWLPASQGQLQWYNEAACGDLRRPGPRSPARPEVSPSSSWPTTRSARTPATSSEISETLSAAHGPSRPPSRRPPASPWGPRCPFPSRPSPRRRA